MAGVGDATAVGAVGVLGALLLAPGLGAPIDPVNDEAMPPASSDVFTGVACGCSGGWELFVGSVALAGGVNAACASPLTEIVPDGSSFFFSSSSLDPPNDNAATPSTDVIPRARTPNFLRNPLNRFLVDPIEPSNPCIIPMMPLFLSSMGLVGVLAIAGPCTFFASAVASS